MTTCLSTFVVNSQKVDYLSMCWILFLPPARIPVTRSRHPGIQGSKRQNAHDGAGPQTRHWQADSCGRTMAAEPNRLWNSPANQNHASATKVAAPGKEKVHLSPRCDRFKAAAGLCAIISTSLVASDLTAIAGWPGSY